MTLQKSILLYLFATLMFPAISQTSLGTITGDESDLYAQTKQVNQFFRRFNNEEDRFGVRYYPGDSLYHNNAFRNVYLNMLFDHQNTLVSEETRQYFIEDVIGGDEPFYLDFHGGLWFAEVAATFEYEKAEENLLLFLQLEQENLGYKWVFTNVYFYQFLKLFFKGDDEQIKKSFLHPMSHELDFMNLYKAFKNSQYLEYYADDSFQPDYLTLLLYELKRDRMKFIRSGAVKFHFFQVDGWYFELAYFNRPGNNSGWLISKLYKISEEEKRELIKFYKP